MTDIRASSCQSQVVATVISNSIKCKINFILLNSLTLGDFNLARGGARILILKPGLRSILQIVETGDDRI